MIPPRNATCPVGLSLLIIVRTQGPVLSSIYIAVGKPNLQRNFVILQTSIIILFIYPAVVRWGLEGAALTSVTGSCIAMFMQVYWCRRVIALNFGDYVKGYIPGLLMTFVPVITVFVLTLSGINSLFLILISATLALLFSYAAYFGRTLIADYFGISSQEYKKLLISEKISPVKREETTVI